MADYKLSQKPQDTGQHGSKMLVRFRLRQKLEQERKVIKVRSEENRTRIYIMSIFNFDVTLTNAIILIKCMILC